MKKNSIVFWIILVLILAFLGLNYWKKDKVEEGGDSVSTLMLEYHENLVNLQELEFGIIVAIQEEDGEKFNLAVSDFEKETQKAIENIKKIDQYQEVAGSFSSVALAKEERSFVWYHMPVINNLAKAVRDAKENKRTKIYNFLKNEVDSEERKVILKRHNLKTIEDFKKMDISKANKIIDSDPFLYKQVNWGEIARDFGKAAVKSYTEALKGANPFSPKDIAESVLKGDDKEKKKSEVKVKIEKGKGVLIGVRKDFRERMDEIIMDKGEGREYEISEEEEKEIQKILENMDEKVLFSIELKEDQDLQMILPEGDWEATLGAPNKKMQTGKIRLQKNKITKIDASQFGLNEFAFDDEQEKGKSNSEIMGVWEVVDITEKGVDSQEYIKKYGGSLPEMNFVDGEKVIFTTKDGKTKELKYYFEGNSGQINFENGTQDKIWIENGRLYSKSLNARGKEELSIWVYGRK